MLSQDTDVQREGQGRVSQRPSGPFSLETSLLRNIKMSKRITFPDGATVQQLIENLRRIPDQKLKVVGEWESLRIPVHAMEVTFEDEEGNPLEVPIVVLDVDHSLATPL